MDTIAWNNIIPVNGDFSFEYGKPSSMQLETHHVTALSSAPGSAAAAHPYASQTVLQETPDAKRKDRPWDAEEQHPAGAEKTSTAVISPLMQLVSPNSVPQSPLQAQILQAMSGEPGLSSPPQLGGYPVQVPQGQKATQCAVSHSVMFVPG